MKRNQKNKTEKAQISLDFIFAIIIATIFLSGIAITISLIEKDTEELEKNNEAKQILMTVHGAIVTAKAYDVNIDMNINTPTKRNYNECKVIIDNDTTDEDGKDINVIIDQTYQAYTIISDATEAQAEDIFQNIQLEKEKGGQSYWPNPTNNTGKAEIKCGEKVRILETEK